MASLPKQVVVFRAGPHGYDLFVDGRVREYDVDPEDMAAALRRARIRRRVEVWVEDASGYRERMTR